MDEGQGGQGQPPSEWRADVAAVVAAVRFDSDLTAAIDRLAELIVATDEFPGAPQAYVTAGRTALASTEPLAALVSQPHSEGALRKLLRQLADRLEEWLEHGSAAAQMPLDTWRPDDAPQPVAQLERDWSHLARWLGVTFHQVADPLGDLRIAVLRLSSGQLVALFRADGNPVPGTTLMQPGSRPSKAVLEEFLTDTRLPAGVVSAEEYGSY